MRSTIRTGIPEESSDLNRAIRFSVGDLALLDIGSGGAGQRTILVRGIEMKRPRGREVIADRLPLSLAYALRETAEGCESLNGLPEGLTWH